MHQLDAVHVATNAPVLAAGCGVLPPKAAPPPVFFTLDGTLAALADFCEETARNWRRP